MRTLTGSHEFDWEWTGKSTYRLGWGFHGERYTVQEDDRIKQTAINEWQPSSLADRIMQNAWNAFMERKIKRSKFLPTENPYERFLLNKEDFSSIVIQDSKKIHILGSQKDQQGFKNFVTSSE